MYSNIDQWVKYENCTRIIQAYGDQNEYLQMLWSYEEIGILINYFNKDKSVVLPTLCTIDAFLDKMFQNVLFIDISLPCISDLTTINKSYLVQAILNLQNKIQTQDIFIMLEQRCIHLFGLIDTVKGIEKQIEEIKIKHASTTVKLVLEQRQIYGIPKALVQDHISNKLTASAIEIHKNDLAEQEVDLVIICSTSMYLRDDILRRAGESAKQEYETISKRSSLEPFETNPGNLSCRRLLFLPWEMNVTSQDALYP
ncbi:unnamed protein product [Rotaria magnacalcarata]|uniref:Uncharacterized protein n=1 Tax=Rotaria magnacalcarata TaxID=392030 RepID=A0A814Q623_9BILA|nr:unnamed protein product [Rotaria magnacalcarata]